MMYQNLWDATKAGLREMFIANTGLSQENKKMSNKH